MKTTTLWRRGGRQAAARKGVGNSAAKESAQLAPALLRILHIRARQYAARDIGCAARVSPERGPSVSKSILVVCPTRAGKADIFEPVPCCGSLFPSQQVLTISPTMPSEHSSPEGRQGMCSSLSAKRKERGANIADATLALERVPFSSSGISPYVA